MRSGNGTTLVVPSGKNATKDLRCGFFALNPNGNRRGPRDRKISENHVGFSVTIITPRGLCVSRVVRIVGFFFFICFLFIHFFFFFFNAFALWQTFKRSLAVHVCVCVCAGDATNRLNVTESAFNSRVDAAGTETPVSKHRRSKSFIYYYFFCSFFH